MAPLVLVPLQAPASEMGAKPRPQPGNRNQAVTLNLFKWSNWYLKCILMPLKSWWWIFSVWDLHIFVLQCFSSPETQRRFPVTWFFINKGWSLILEFLLKFRNRILLAFSVWIFSEEKDGREPVISTSTRFHPIIYVDTARIISWFVLLLLVHKSLSPTALEPMILRVIPGQNQAQSTA